MCSVPTNENIITGGSDRITHEVLAKSASSNSASPLSDIRADDSKLIDQSHQDDKMVEA